jgi:hypothetical protein
MDMLSKKGMETKSDGAASLAGVKYMGLGNFSSGSTASLDERCLGS